MEAICRAQNSEAALASASLLTLIVGGAGEKSRTPDLRITNALLYQLSYAGGKTKARL
jgi:hypothetical protein